MLVGPATIQAIITSALATLVWWVAKRLSAPDWLCLFVFGVALVLVVSIGPLVRLP